MSSKYTVLVFVTVLSMLTGCAAISAGCRSGADVCSVYGPINGEIFNGTSCAVVVQYTHVCTYDGEGRFKSTDLRPSGACICLSL